MDAPRISACQSNFCTSDTWDWGEKESFRLRSHFVKHQRTFRNGEFSWPTAVDARVRKCHTSSWLLNRAETNLAEQFSPALDEFRSASRLSYRRDGKRVGYSALAASNEKLRQCQPTASSCRRARRRARVFHNSSALVENQWPAG